MAVNKKTQELRSREEWQALLNDVAQSTIVEQGEPREVQEARKEKAKADYKYFVETYLPSIAPCEPADFHVEFAHKVKDNPNNVAVAEWPREHAKSVVVNVCIPLWLLANDDLTGMICMCKSNPDACNQLSDIQAQLMENKLFIHDFGDQYNAGDWAEGDFTTIKGIRFKALGRDQSARGLRKGKFRPNYATGDDIDDDDLVENTRRVKKIVKKFLGALGGALQMKRWRLIVANNRIHPMGFLAHIVGDLKPGMPKRENLIHSKVYAEKLGYPTPNGEPTWYQNFKIEELQAKYALLGPELTMREFFHKYSIEGTIFLDSYIQFKKLPNYRDYKVIIGYFDPSFVNSETSDYKAVAIQGLLMKDNGQYEIHVLKNFCRRCELFDVFYFMADFNNGLPRGVGIIWYIESQFVNDSFRKSLDEFNQLNGSTLWLIEDNRDKEQKFTRIVMMQPVFSLKKVYFNIEEANNSDTEEAINQLKGIEPGYGGADDWPDALEGGMYYLKMHITANTGSGKSKISPRTRKHSY